MATINAKTRGNYALSQSFTDEDWKQIFGDKKVIQSDKIGNAPKDRATLADYDLTRRTSKILADYRNFKDPKDRVKIKNEFFGVEHEYRKNHTFEKV